MFPTRDSTSGVCVPTIIGGNAGNVSWPAIATVSSSHASLFFCPSLPITEFPGTNPANFLEPRFWPNFRVADNPLLLGLRTGYRPNGM